MIVPYFPRQHKHPCGHYYPDVLVAADIKHPDGRYYRVLNCVRCGSIVQQIRPEEWSSHFIAELDLREVIVRLQPEDMPFVRARELERLVQKN